MEKSTVQRLAWATGSFFLAAGLEVSGIEAPRLATALWVVAGVIFLVAIAWNRAPVLALRSLFSVPWPAGATTPTSETASGTGRPIRFYPDTTDRGNALIGVRNSGLDGEFEATGEILGVSGDPNPERRLFFKGCWLATDEGIMPIGTGQTRQLKIGEYYVEDERDEYGHGRLHRLDLIRQEAGDCEPWEWFRWHGLDENRPEIRLEITVNRLGADAPSVSEEFVIRTHEYGGVSVTRPEEATESTRE